MQNWQGFLLSWKLRSASKNTAVFISSSIVCALEKVLMWNFVVVWEGQDSVVTVVVLLRIAYSCCLNNCGSLTVSNPLPIYQFHFSVLAGFIYFKLSYFENLFDIFCQLFFTTSLIPTIIYTVFGVRSLLQIVFYSRIETTLCWFK